MPLCPSRRLNFFALPDSATELGIGAGRHWLIKLAHVLTYSSACVSDATRLMSFVTSSRTLAASA